MLAWHIGDKMAAGTTTLCFWQSGSNYNTWEKNSAA
jgi:hypothetical protein